MSNNLGSLVSRSVEHIGTSANWFRWAVGEQHVQIQRSSAIEGALNRLDIFRGLGEFGVQVPWPREDRYEFFAEAIGADFLTKTVHRGVLRGLCLPRERWRQFVGGDPIITRAGARSPERDRVWETVLGCAAATFASGVRFDEPDITCTFEGVQLGVAAKFPHSEKRLMERIRAGAKQTVGQSLPGLVAVNIVDLLPVAEIYRQSVKQRFRDSDTAGQWARRRVGALCERLQINAMARMLKDLAPLLIGVAFFTPMLICLNDSPFPLFDTSMPVTWGEPYADFAFARAFLDACNDVLGFTAPSEHEGVAPPESA